MPRRINITYEYGIYLVSPLIRTVWENASEEERQNIDACSILVRDHETGAVLASVSWLVEGDRWTVDMPVIDGTRLLDRNLPYCLQAAAVSMIHAIADGEDRDLNPRVSLVKAFARDKVVVLLPTKPAAADSGALEALKRPLTAETEMRLFQDGFEWIKAAERIRIGGREERAIKVSNLNMTRYFEIGNDVANWGGVKRAYRAPALPKQISKS